MEFAGNEYIYLSKLKKEKIKKLQEAEKENAQDAPVIKEEEEEDEKEEKVDKKKKDMEVDEDEKEDDKEEKEDDKEEDNISKKLKKYSKKVNLNKSLELALSDDANLSVNSCEFDMDMEQDSNDSVNEEPAPMNQNKKEGKKYQKEIDVNVCLIKYDGLEKEAENNVLRLYQCEKCKAYLNKYSNLVPNENKYDWKCEFCHHENKDLILNKVDIPLSDTIENCIAPGVKKDSKTPEKDDSSLVFCFDISGSMCQSYDIGRNLKNQFNKILGKKDNKNKFKMQRNDSGSEGSDDDPFDYNMENTSYISRLDLVKCSIQNNINSLLKNAPDTKVGIVSFGSDIEVKGDCLSNVMMIKEKDMNNESKIKSLGEENTNLIKASIKESHKEIIKALNATEENGSTALGPAVLMSLSLLKNAKIGSRIFLCTDGMSNLGVGNISENKDNAKVFYTKIGEMAKEKGIIINLITFQDSESEIDILMSMVEKSGGEIIRVNPNAILDGFNDLLENEALALAEMKDINFEELKNLIFQIEINYRNKSGGKFVRIITKNMKVSDNKEEVEKQANYNIITAAEIQKSAKLAGAGLIREAQAQAHVARKFLSKNKKNNKESYESYQMFNNNMNLFNKNLEYNYQNQNMMDDDSDEEDDKKDKSDYKAKKKEKMKKKNSNKEFDSKDLMSEQIFSLSRTSQNKQKLNFKRNKKK